MGSGTGGSGGLFGTGGGTTTTGSGTGGGGPTTCDTSCVDAGGQCVNGTCVISENQGAVPPGLQTSLENGGNGDASLRYLYPYDQTIFPRGLLPPSIQLDGAPPEASYLHIHFPGFEYKGFYGASSPGRILLSQPVWKALTLSATGKLDVKVEVTKSTANNPKVDACVAQAFKRVKFPAPADGATSVITFPITFNGLEVVN